MAIKNATIREMRAYAVFKGGKCHTTRYIGDDYKVEFECAEGHKWWEAPIRIRQLKTWCPNCSSKKRGTIEQMRAHAAFRGGKCLSESFLNSRTKLEWECKNGHTWWAAPLSVKNRGSWCPRCAPRNKRKGSIDEARKLAKINGCICLSTEYVSIHAKLEFVCAAGHQWLATLKKMRQPNAGCPYCADMRNAEGIVVHRWSLEYMQEVARSKNGECLSIEYVNSSTNIQWECEKGHRWQAVPYNVIYNGTWCPECAGKKKGTIEDMQALARSKGGKCLSTEYVYKLDKRLQWQCAKGHTWWTTAGEIKNADSWCPECAGKKKMTIDDIQDLAASKGGKCLSTEYIPKVSKRIHWQCEKGHDWWAAPSDIKNTGTWCPTCAGKKKGTIEQMQELAQSKDGKCLSKEYKNALTNLLWECSQGHIWRAAPNSVKNNGTWCPECIGRKKRPVNVSGL